MSFDFLAWASRRWALRLGAAALGLAPLMAPVSATAALPLIEDLPALQQRFAALLAGNHGSTSCSAAPGDGRPPAPGRVVIGSDGRLTVGPVSLWMFDRQGQFALGKKYGAQGPLSPARGLNYELLTQGRMFSMNADNDGADTFVEAGFSGDTRNVTRDGMICAGTDLRASRLARPVADLHDFMVAAFDTGGAVVSGQCRPMRLPKGQRAADAQRTVRFSLSAAGLTIDGQTLRFDDAGNPLAEAGLGSRFSDGTLNGDFVWRDGRGFHVERFMGPGGRFAVFSVGQAGDSASQLFCQVRGAGRP